MEALFQLLIFYLSFQKGQEELVSRRKVSISGEQELAKIISSIRQLPILIGDDFETHAIKKNVEEMYDEMKDDSNDSFDELEDDDDRYFVNPTYEFDVSSNFKQGQTISKITQVNTIKL